MRNSLSNFKEAPDPTLPGTAPLRAGGGVASPRGRGAGLGWQGLFGDPWRKEQRRRCCDFFQQFLGLSRRSQPLPPRLHLPCCGGGSVFIAARLLGFFSASILTWGDYFPQVSAVPWDRVGRPSNAWPWEAHISAEGGIADLDRSPGTGAVGVSDCGRTPSSEQKSRTLLGRTLPTPQPPGSPTRRAGTGTLPLRAQAVSQAGFAFLALFPTAALWT